MRLLASTDFALRILMLLARDQDGGRMSVEQLAHELGGLSRNHLHKIVQDLTTLGITRTVRGAGGGVALSVESAGLHRLRIRRQQLQAVRCIKLPPLLEQDVVHEVGAADMAEFSHCPGHSRGRLR